MPPLLASAARRILSRDGACHCGRHRRDSDHRPVLHRQHLACFARVGGGLFVVAIAANVSGVRSSVVYFLLGLVTFIVLPVFALANAGVTLGSGLIEAYKSATCLGIIVGLFVGKQLGILGFSWIAVNAGVATLPMGMTWRQVHGVGVLSGVGFTMSIFVASLAFPGAAGQQDVAKVGILSASLIAGVFGVILLRWATGPAKSTRP